MSLSATTLTPSISAVAQEQATKSDFSHEAIVRFKTNIDAVRKQFDGCNNSYTTEQREKIFKALDSAYQGMHQACFGAATTHASAPIHAATDADVKQTASSLSELCFIAGRIWYADNSRGREQSFARSEKLFALSYLFLSTVPFTKARILGLSNQENLSKVELHIPATISDTVLSSFDKEATDTDKEVAFAAAESLRNLGFCVQNDYHRIEKLLKKDSADKYIDGINAIYDRAAQLYERVNTVQTQEQMGVLIYNTAPFRVRIQAIKDHYRTHPKESALTLETYGRLWGSPETTRKAIATYVTVLGPHLAKVQNPVFVNKWKAQIENNTAVQLWGAFAEDPKEVQQHLPEWYQRVSTAVEIADKNDIGEEFLRVNFHANRAAFGVEAIERQIHVIAIPTLLASNAESTQTTKARYSAFPPLTLLEQDISIALKHIASHPHDYSPKYYITAVRISLLQGDKAKALKYLEDAGKTATDEFRKKLAEFKAKVDALN